MASSEELFAEAKKYLPGGVNSPVRACLPVEMAPRFIERGCSSRIYDVEGNDYVDYVNSWGSLILGHAHAPVVLALKQLLDAGTSFGAPTLRETQLASQVVESLPSVEMVRFVNSGTEAVMSALRVARGCTGKNKILKFEGCYHGHADSLLVEAGSGFAALSIPASPGVTPGVAGDTLVASYNNLEEVEEIYSQWGREIAAVIVEPVAGNMGVVPPGRGFLEGLRRITSENGSLLIFDEVITGFRLSYGGAQEFYKVQPDLTCLGKVIGGGLPLAAFGGRRELMEQVAPAGPIYQTGTLSGNPLAMEAGIETLAMLQHEGVYEQLEERSAMLEEGLREAARACSVEIRINRAGSMFSVFFTSEEVNDYASAQKADLESYRVFYQTMIRERIYVPPSPLEAMFVSLSHTVEDIEETLAAVRRAFDAVSRSAGEA